MGFNSGFKGLSTKSKTVPLKNLNKYSYNAKNEIKVIIDNISEKVKKKKREYR